MKSYQYSFEGMAKHPAGFDVSPFVDGIGYFRNGDVIDWKNHFTPEVSEKFETQ